MKTSIKIDKPLKTIEKLGRKAHSMQFHERWNICYNVFILHQWQMTMEHFNFAITFTNKIE